MMSEICVEYFFAQKQDSFWTDWIYLMKFLRATVNVTVPQPGALRTH